MLVETHDAFMGAWAEGQWPDHLGAATGPIAIEGAAPGDALRIDLLDVVPVELAPGRGAVHQTSGKLGFLAKEFDRHYPVVMAIRDGHLVHPKGFRIPLRPSLGFIGTTDVEPRKTSSDSGAYGGDIDMKELAGGSTVWLPVIQDHIKVALALGVSKEMILAAIELAFMGGGFIAVQHGVLAWQETVGADRVEPTVDALEAYKARAASATS